ncbi:MAG: phosphoribosyl-ATP diphosphatase [Sphingomonadaceae bacterium]
MADTLTRLEAIIRERRIGDPALSYVAQLTAAGRAKMAQKVGEEAVETVIAAVADDPKAVVSESADLLFHLAILLADMNVSFVDIMAELDRRDGVSGLAEKAARTA